MPIFYVCIDVRFKSPIHLVGEQNSKSRKEIGGFIQEIGCTANSEKVMKRTVERFALLDYGKSNTDVSFDRVGIIAENDVRREIYQDEDIRKALRDSPTKNGIWYATGRGFYVKRKETISRNARVNAIS